MHKILVVEGNAKATSDVMTALGGTPYGISYAALLESMSPSVECSVVYPSEDGIDCLPSGTTFSDFAGIVWTGSALNCYTGQTEVTNQIELAKDAFDSGTPIFGSCWGLQVMTMALGGSVRCNPKGRELGIGRCISLSPEGRNHPMYSGKLGVFEAFEVHMDEIDVVPEGAVVLAGNAMSDVQAMAVERGASSFWGVQYHPEFDFATMAIIYQRLTNTLLKEGLYPTRESVQAQISEYTQLNSSAFVPSERGISAEVADPSLRRLEILNWLNSKVLG